MNLSQSAKNFLERIGERETLRRPQPTMRTDNPVHQTPVSYPNPLPQLVLDQSGAPAPDRIVTRIWPNGVAPS